jgi:hypothetical protein
MDRLERLFEFADVDAEGGVFGFCEELDGGFEGDKGRAYVSSGPC